MPNTKSAKKNLKQSTKARERNRSVKTELKSTIKKVRGATSADEGGKVFVIAQTKLDRAAARGIIHKNKAARLKSKLSKTLKAVKAAAK